MADDALDADRTAEPSTRRSVSSARESRFPRAAAARYSGGMPIKITCRPNGPYLVENDGTLELYDPTGAKVDLAGKSKFALCRCGGSTTKPFCDGTHSKTGFQAAEAAVMQQKP